MIAPMLVSLGFGVLAVALYTIVQGVALGIAEGLRIGLRRQVIGRIGGERSTGMRREVGYRPGVLTSEVIGQAARRLADVAAAPAQVFLFGSHARGDATQDSDLDFLVVERGIEPTAEEWVRLRDALPPLGVPVDVIVMSDDLVRRRRDVPGSLVYTALREGRLVAES
jgi:predicted nucleotidyltransferase